MQVGGCFEVRCPISHAFFSLHCADLNSNGFICDYELHELFREANLPLPGYKVREIIQKLMIDSDKNKDGKISFEEFVYVSTEGCALRQPKRLRSLQALVLVRLNEPVSEGNGGSDFSSPHSPLHSASWPFPSRTRCRDGKCAIAPLPVEILSGLDRPFGQRCNLPLETGGGKSKVLHQRKAAKLSLPGNPLSSFQSFLRRCSSFLAWEGSSFSAAKPCRQWLDVHEIPPSMLDPQMPADGVGSRC